MNLTKITLSKGNLENAKIAHAELLVAVQKEKDEHRQKYEDYVTEFLKEFPDQTPPDFRELDRVNHIIEVLLQCEDERDPLCQKVCGTITYDFDKISIEDAYADLIQHTTTCDSHETSESL